MGAYNYIAIDTKGKEKKGILEGDSPRHIRQSIREQGLTPLDVIAISDSKKSSTSNFRFAKRVKGNDLALLTRQLATLLAASMPIEECLQGVGEQTEKEQIKSIIHGVRSRVLEGHSLANAMSHFPNAFPELYCATVGAGEQTGRLDIVLNRLADYTEQQQGIRAKVQQALIYPALMTFVSIAIVTFLLVFVVPKIIGVFNSTGQSLPEVTVILMAISHNVKNFGIYYLVAIIAFLFGFKHLLKRHEFRKKWHKLLLKLPLLGYAIKTVNTARYARTFGILSAAGVPILEAMRVSSSLITNIPMRDAISNASNRVREGANINYALKQSAYFSPMTLHLIASGERSGRLEEMLERAADNQDNEVKRLIETGLTLFEPMIILIMGAVVLFIVLAILLPIFQMDQFVR